MIDEQTAVVTGRGAVASLRDYAQEVASYSRGRGSFSVSPAGYGLCHNAEEVVLQSGYRAESDLDNPTGSVFCAGGSAVYVSWDEVDERAHTASYLAARQSAAPAEAGAGTGGSGAGTGAGAGCTGDVSARNAAGRPDGRNAEATQKELDDIFLRTYGKSKRDEDLRRRQTGHICLRVHIAPSRPRQNHPLSAFCLLHLRGSAKTAAKGQRRRVRKQQRRRGSCLKTPHKKASPPILSFQSMREGLRS